MHSKKYFIGNWKMNGLKKDLIHLLTVEKFLKKNIKYKAANYIFCIPYTILGFGIFNKKLKIIKLGSQDISKKSSDFGAFTGEVSAKMIKDLNCNYTIIGHSESRAAGDSDRDINLKIKHALDMDFKIIYCVGESIGRFKKKQSLSYVKKQIDLNLKNNLSKTSSKNIILAYEPIWSIGSGLVPDNHYLNNFFFEIKKHLKKKFKADLPILYGGSVSQKNISILKNLKLCNGFLVGGASLKSNNFIDIIKKYYS